MNAAELISQLEDLSPVELQQEIDAAELQLGMMRRLLAVITGESPPTAKKPRQPRAPKPAADPAATPRPILTGEPAERVITFLRDNSPASHRAILQACGLSVKQAAEVLSTTPDIVRDEETKTYSLQS